MDDTDICNHTIRLYDKKRAEIICSDCGLVLEERLFEEEPLFARTRFEGLSEKRISKNTPTSRVGGERYTGFTGKKRRWNKVNSLSSKEEKQERFMKDSFNLIISILEQNGVYLPKHSKEGSYSSFEEFVKEGYAIGRKYSFLIAYNIYNEMLNKGNLYWCGKDKERTVFDEEKLIKILNLTKKEYHKFKKVIRKGKKPAKLFFTLDSILSSFPNYFLLELNQDGVKRDILYQEIELVTNLAKSYVKNENFSGRSYLGIAAGAVYTAIKELQKKRELIYFERFKQKEISEIFGVTEVTLRTNYHCIKNSQKQK